MRLPLAHVLSGKHKEKVMNEEGYSIPQAELDKEENKEVPVEILKKIKYAWIAGIISIAVTVVLTLISMSGTDIPGLDAFSFIDVFLMVIFTFGTYKKSRTCAILMLLLFSVNRLIVWFDSGNTISPLALVFLWFYTMGVVGTFQFHRFKNKQNV